MGGSAFLPPPLPPLFATATQAMGALAGGQEKEGELATSSLESEYLHQESRC